MWGRPSLVGTVVGRKTPSHLSRAKDIAIHVTKVRYFDPNRVAAKLSPSTRPAALIVGERATQESEKDLNTVRPRNLLVRDEPESSTG